MPHRSDRQPGGDACWRFGYPELLIGFLVAVAAAVSFLPVLENRFVDHWDDGVNFSRNVSFRGLGWKQICWAWTTRLQGSYQPIAWMILEFEYVLFALEPTGYHFTSLILHAANAVGLYAVALVIARRTMPESGQASRRASAVLSGVFATLFAVHPLRVEVVAWASCQPYLPCAGFAILAVLAYLRSHSSVTRHVGWLAISVLFFAAAVGCKAPAVGLPVVLLLLDATVLRRATGWRFPREAWTEKAPFVAIALVAAWLAIRAKSDEPRLLDPRPPGIARIVERAAIAMHGLEYYVQETVYPHRISAYHYLPERVELANSRFVTAFAGVSVVLLIAVLTIDRHPAVLATVLTYMALVAPNLGLLRYDVMMAADRYAYIATMPIFVFLAGVSIRWAAEARRPGVVCSMVALPGLVAILYLGAASRQLCRTWQNSDSLVAHALAAEPERPGLLLSHYGRDLIDLGRVRQGMSVLRKAVELAPDDPDARVNLGVMLGRQRDLAGAIAQFSAAVQADPDRSDLRRNLGVALLEAGRPEEAIVSLTEAVRLRPDRAIVHVARGDALAALELDAEAKAEYDQALELEPGNPDARAGLARLRQPHREHH